MEIKTIRRREGKSLEVGLFPDGDLLLVESTQVGENISVIKGILSIEGSLMGINSVGTPGIAGPCERLQEVYSSFLKEYLSR